jgi:very-short-patch-repair endonuclease
MNIKRQIHDALISIEHAQSGSQDTLSEFYQKKGRKMGIPESPLENIFLTDTKLDVKKGTCIDGITPDFILGKNVVIEIDGKQFHSSQEDRDRDASRDTKYANNNYYVIRVSSDIIYEAMPTVDAAIERMLRHGFLRLGKTIHLNAISYEDVMRELNYHESLLLRD